MKAHRMTARKRAEQHVQLRQALMIDAGRQVARKKLAERYGFWQEHHVSDAMIVGTLEILINENERRRWPLWAHLPAEHHRHIAVEELERYKKG